MQLIKDLWNGDKSLPFTFWGLSFLLFVLDKTIALFMELRINIIIVALLVLFLFAARLFSIFAVWNSANKYEGNKYWVYIVRTIVVFGVFAFVADISKVLSLIFGS